MTTITLKVLLELLLVRLYHLGFPYKSFYIRVFADLFRMGNACEEHDWRDG